MAYFVSPTGNDAWSGKLDAPNAAGTDGPLESLDMGLRKAHDDPNINDVVMRGGDYAIDHRINLNQIDSGVHISAYGNESPVLKAAPGVWIALSLDNADNVTVEGLSFEGGSRSGYAVSLVNTEGAKIGDNAFNGVGTAVKLYQSSGNAIGGNTMDHLGGFGVELDTSHNNDIYANTIQNAGEVNKNASGVGGHGSSDNLVAFNDISHTARYGVSFKDFGPSDASYRNAVDHNHISNTNTDGGDSAAVEFLGRSNVDHGHQAVGNWIEHTGNVKTSGGVGAGGIYLDDLTNGSRVTDNFIKDTSWTSVMVHGGDKNVIDNNFFLLGGEGGDAVIVSDNGNIGSGSKADGNVLSHNILYGEDYAESPWLLNNSGVNPVYDNLLYNVARTPGVDDSSGVGDPLFANRDGGDYRLSANSPAFAEGIHDLDWGNMGLSGWDDASAQQYGLTDFWTG